MKPMPATYTRTARLFHWITALAVLIAIPLAVAAENAVPADKGQLFFLHKSFGVLIFAIVALRAAHRLIMGVPLPHPSMTPLERTASRAGHWMLYVLLILIPLLGWYGTSAFGRPPSFFGLFTLPPIAPADEALGRVVMDMHVAAAFALIVLVVGHVCLALYHAVMRKDGVLMRMVTGDQALPPQ